MNRLTEKENDYYMQSKNCESIFDLTDKLGQLEDIEQELGIDLITLFKTLTKDFYIKKYDTNYSALMDEYNLGYQCLHYSKHNKCFYIGGANENEDDYIGVFLKTNDYGKTRSLAKEELKNDRQTICTKKD